MANTKYFYWDSILILSFLIIKILFICDCVNCAEDFKKLVDKEVFVDKSEFIKEFLECEGKIAFITRPSGFGKSINLDMLKNFLTIEVDEYGNSIQKKNNEKYFTNLGIAKYKNIFDDYYGKYPVIYVSFKNVKGSMYNEIQNAMELSIKEAFLQHRYLLQVKTLGEYDKKTLEKYFHSEKLNYTDVEYGLNRLSEFLTRHFKKRTFILVDDFDRPIHKAFLNTNDSRDRELIEDTVATILTATYNVNDEYIERGLISGILPLQDHDMFGGFDNYKSYSTQDSKFSTIFGFTDQEVTDLLKKLQKINEKQIIRQRYGGYCFNNDTYNVNEYHKLYQPRSVMKYLENENNKLEDDDSELTLLQMYVNNNGERVIAQIFKLVKNETINGYKSDKRITHYWRYGAYGRPKSIFFTFGFHFGYFNLEGERTMQIPNTEVQNILAKILRNYLSSNIDDINDKKIIETGDIMYEILRGKNFPELTSRFNSFFEALFKKIKMDNFFKMTTRVWFDGCIYLFAVSSKYRNDFEIFTKAYAKKQSYLGIYADLVIIPIDGKGSEAYIMNYRVSKFKRNLTRERKVTNQTDYKTLSKKFSHIKTICNINVTYFNSDVKVKYETIKL